MLVFIGAVKGSDGLLEPTRGTSIQEGVVLFLRCYKYAAAWMLDHPNGDANDELRADLCAYASIFEGYPYVYGASGPNSFDCSGFTMYVFAQAGIKLPHGATSQLSYGTEVSRSDLQPGDLVFFQDYGYTASHVGIYIGGDQFIHASSSYYNGHCVVITSLSETYYNNHYLTARRH